MQRPNKKKGNGGDKKPLDPEDNSKCRRVYKVARNQTKGHPFVLLLKAIGIFVLLLALVGLSIFSDAYKPWSDGRYSIRMADKPELGKQAAQWLIGKSSDAIFERGRFVVALSGGSMPKLLKAGMTEVDGLQASTDWKKWHVVWADERCVDFDSDDSTFKAWKDFFDEVGIPADQVHNIDVRELDDPAKAAASYEEGLVALKLYTEEEVAMDHRHHSGSHILPLPMLDVAMLGMGGDGHTASLFPGHQLLGETTLRVASLTDSPKPPDSRITLTLPVLNHARDVGFLVTGAGKAEAVSTIISSWLEKALAFVHSMSIRAPGRHAFGTHAAYAFIKYGMKPKHPASLIMPKKGNLVWFLDTSAGGMLPEDVQQRAQNTHVAAQ